LHTTNWVNVLLTVATMRKTTAFSIYNNTTWPYVLPTPDP
jgi:hypothetical protein